MSFTPRSGSHIRYGMRPSERAAVASNGKLMIDARKYLPMAHTLLWVVLYIAAGALSWHFNVPSAPAPHVWLPAGVSLAAMLLSQPTSQVRLAIAFALTQVVLSHIGGRDIPLSIVLGILAGIAPAVADAVVRWMRISLDGFHLLHAIVIAALVSATLLGGSGAAYVSAVSGAPFVLLFQEWGAAIFVGICVTTPLLAVWAQFRPQRSSRRNWREVIVCRAAFVTLIGASWALFDRVMAERFGAYVGACLLYLPMFFVVIVAVAGGARGGTLAVLVLALISLGKTAQGEGPFASADIEERVALLQAQLYLGITAILVLIVHSLHDARAQALDQAHQWRTHLELALAGSGMVTYCADPHRSTLQWGGDIDQFLGYSGDSLRTFDQVLALVHPSDRTHLYDHWMAAALEVDTAPRPIRFRLAHRDRPDIWIALTDAGSALRNPNGSVALVAGVWQRSNDPAH